MDDYSWARKEIEDFKKFSTLKSERGQDIADRLWIRADKRPKSLDGHRKLWNDMQAFIHDENEPEEDRDKISGLVEMEYMMLSAWEESANEHRSGTEK